MAAAKKKKPNGKAPRPPRAPGEPPFGDGTKIPLDLNTGFPIEGSEISEAIARTMPMDPESLLISQQIQDTQARRSRGEKTRFAPESHILYEQAVKFHPHAMVKFKQLSPSVGDLPPRPVAALRDWGALINYLQSSYWTGEESEYKWTVGDGANPTWATGLVKFPRRIEQAQPQAEEDDMSRQGFPPGYNPYGFYPGMQPGMGMMPGMGMPGMPFQQQQWQPGQQYPQQPQYVQPPYGPPPQYGPPPGPPPQYGPPPYYGPPPQAPPQPPPQAPQAAPQAPQATPQPETQYVYIPQPYPVQVPAQQPPPTQLPPMPPAAPGDPALVQQMLGQIERLTTMVADARSVAQPQQQQQQPQYPPVQYFGNPPQAYYWDGRGWIQVQTTQPAQAAVAVKPEAPPLPPPPPPTPMEMARETFTHMRTMMAMGKAIANEFNPAAPEPETPTVPEVPAADDSFPFSMKDLPHMRFVSQKDGSPVDATTQLMFNFDKIGDIVKSGWKEVRELIDKRQEVQASQEAIEAENRRKKLENDRLELENNSRKAALMERSAPLIEAWGRAQSGQQPPAAPPPQYAAPPPPQYAAPPPPPPPPPPQQQYVAQPPPPPPTSSFLGAVTAGLQEQAAEYMELEKLEDAQEEALEALAQEEARRAAQTPEPEPSPPTQPQLEKPEPPVEFEPIVEPPSP